MDWTMGKAMARTIAATSLIAALGTSTASAASHPFTRQVAHAQANGCATEVHLLSEHRMDGSIVPGITVPVTTTTCTEALLAVATQTRLQLYPSLGLLHRVADSFHLDDQAIGQSTQFDCGYGNPAHANTQADSQGFNGYVRIYNYYNQTGTPGYLQDTFTLGSGQTRHTTAQASPFIDDAPNAIWWTKTSNTGLGSGTNAGCGS